MAPSKKPHRRRIYIWDTLYIPSFDVVFGISISPKQYKLVLNLYSHRKRLVQKYGEIHCIGVLKKAFDTVEKDAEVPRFWYRACLVYVISPSQTAVIQGQRCLFTNKKCIVVYHKDLVLDLLFIVYINDLPFCLESCQVTMYAGDTSISFAVRSVNDQNVTLNKELGSLWKWLQGNKLLLNVLKTQAVVIGSRSCLKRISKKLVEPPSFSIDGSEVEMVDNVEYLGVQIDTYLAWDEHTDFVQSKVSRAI